MSNTKASIIIIEDNENYRNVIKRALKNESDLELTNLYGTAEVALREIQHATADKTADLVLLDLNLPGMDGLEALFWLKKYSPDSHVIVLTQSHQEENILKAIQLGASGYLLKSSSASQIKESIRTALTGGAILDPDVTSLIFQKLRNEPTETTHKITLTDREREILVQISEGIEKKQIAESLQISSNTVAFHVKNIYDKLGVTNAPAAVRQAFRSGILNPRK